MADFFLIHGAWHGGWCWADVAQQLRARGHRVWAPSLTGLADRAHLLSPQVTINTHVQDVVGLIRSESTGPCILVGHSYAGNVISGVADQLREAIDHYVFVDASLPPDGASSWRWCDQHTPEGQAQRLGQIAGEGGGLVLPAPPAEVFGIENPTLRERVQARLMPMPGSIYASTLMLRQGGSAGLRRTYIAAVDPVYAPLKVVHDQLRHRADWHFLELAGGHDLMVTAPDALTEVLASAV